MFLFHFLITLGTALSLFRAHLNIPSTVSFYPDTRTMTSSQEPACGGWLAKARTLQKASWHPKPGMSLRNTTSLWRRPKPFSRCGERWKQFCYSERREKRRRRKRSWLVKNKTHIMIEHWDHPKDLLNSFGCRSSLNHCRFHGSESYDSIFICSVLKKKNELTCERYVLTIQYCKDRKLNRFISKLCHLYSCTLHNCCYNWMKDDV